MTSRLSSSSNAEAAEGDAAEAKTQTARTLTRRNFGVQSIIMLGIRDRQINNTNTMQIFEYINPVEMLCPCNLNKTNHFVHMALVTQNPSKMYHPQTEHLVKISKSQSLNGLIYYVS